MTQSRRKFAYGPISEGDLGRYAALLDHAFSDNPSATPEATWQRQAGLDCFRVVRVAEEIASGMGMLRMGQWFGGRSVPTAGIVAVVVAPEHRGGGVASFMMRSALEEMRADGLALSVLYASTQLVYRRVGYEQAGVSIGYRIPLATLPTRDKSLTVRAATPADEPAMHRLYTERARQTNGNLDRHPVQWEWLLRERPPVNTYVVEREGVAEGYVVYGQRTGPRDTGKVIRARDLVATTPAANRRLLAFLADHRRVAEHLAWHGPAADPITFQIPEQDYTVSHVEQWLLRILNVPAALAARGYPAGVTAEVHLAVRDDVLPENDGPVVLAVADGRAEVRPGGDGRVTLDVRGLAPLYSGYLSPAALKSIGALNGPDEDLARLATIFAGPGPWMPDNF